MARVMPTTLIRERFHLMDVQDITTALYDRFYAADYQSR
jgi:hypothetical protein